MQRPGTPRLATGATLAALLTLAAGSPLAADKAQGPLLPRDSPDAAVFRGGLVFMNYCATCHGANADGNGRAARLYTPPPANLRLTDKDDAYISRIVTGGGEKVGRSPNMPPWGEELTDEQIHDVVAFVRSINVFEP